MGIKKMKENMKEIQIPFCGFYESWASEGIDARAEQEFEELKEDGKEIIMGEYYVNYTQGLVEQYCKDYVDGIKEILEEELDFKTTMEFVEATSPKEYNFETDKIYVKIPYSELETLMESLDLDAMQKMIENRMDSRDGFASFYPTFSKEWRNKEISDWDENELSMIMYTGFKMIMGDAHESSIIHKLDNEVFQESNAIIDDLCIKKYEAQEAAKEKAKPKSKKLKP
jgi:hypothetical protein